MSQPHFVIVSGPEKDHEIVLKPGDGHLMGRHQETAYQINDPRASRFHCEIQLVDGKVTVVDHGGSGGTLVNGAKVQTQELKAGDQLQLGDTTLKFNPGSDSEAETINRKPQQAGDDAKAVEQLAELSGRTLAHFEIGTPLGKGESSVVFRATDQKKNRPVALKVMKATFSKSEDDMQRFVRGMKSMLPLQHENLVRLYGAGKTGPYCWASMELVEGESMSTVIERIGIAGMLDWKYAFRVAVHVGRGLAYAHGEGIIHRNITPTNILLRSEDKVVKLGDLMLAKALEGSLAQQVTKPGELVGDVNYMSPERTQGQGEGVDGRSDLFSLAATVYALLTGKPPFAGSSLVETITNIRQKEPAQPSKSQMGIPSTFEAVVLKLLAKRPEDRYQKAEQVVEELERVAKYNGVQF